MPGRGRIHRQAFDDGRRGYPDIREGPYVRGPVPRQHHPARIEDELELRLIELRRLAADNRSLLEDRAVLQREMVAAKEELQRMNFAIADIRNEKEGHTRDLIERGFKLEADLSAAEPVRIDVIQLRKEVQTMNAIKEQLSGEVQKGTHELSNAKSQNQQIPFLRNEIEGLRQELTRIRTSFEYEKKGNVELIDQRQAMEKNLVSMAREIEKLRAELSNKDGRPWGVGGAYGTKLGSPEGAFSSYGDGYGLHSGVADKAPLYGAGSGSWGAYEKAHLARR